MTVPSELYPASHEVVVATNRVGGHAQQPLRVVVVMATSLLAVVAVVALAGGGAPGKGALLSWNNYADDGAGILGGQQHGVSMVITSCDADGIKLSCATCSACGGQAVEMLQLVVLLLTCFCIRHLSGRPCVHVSNVEGRIQQGAVGNNAGQ